MKKQNYYKPRYISILRFVTTALFAVFIAFCIISSVSVSRLAKTGKINLFEYDIRMVGTTAILVRPDAYDVGDTVAINDGVTITRTVLSKSTDGNTVTVGDANGVNATYSVSAVYGEVTGIRPVLGKVFTYLTTTRGILLALVIPAVLLAILELTIITVPFIPFKQKSVKKRCVDVGYYEPLEYDGDSTD